MPDAARTLLLKNFGNSDEAVQKASLHALSKLQDFSSEELELVFAELNGASEKLIYSIGFLLTNRPGLPEEIVFPKAREMLAAGGAQAGVAFRIIFSFGERALPLEKDIQQALLQVETNPEFVYGIKLLASFGEPSGKIEEILLKALKSKTSPASKLTSLYYLEKFPQLVKSSRNIEEMILSIQENENKQLQAIATKILSSSNQLARLK